MILSNTIISLNSRNMTFFNDPGHGWLKVNKSVLSTLGIVNKISGFSYMKNDYVYLEEDLDTGIFFDALVEKGFEKQEVVNFKQSIKDRYVENSSRIRNYPTY